MIFGHTEDLGSYTISSIWSLDSHIAQGGGDVVQNAGDLWMSGLVFLNPICHFSGKHRKLGLRGDLSLHLRDDRIQTIPGLILRRDGFRDFLLQVRYEVFDA